jgi:hypothetical protein
MVSLGWAGLDPAHIWDETSSLGVSIPYTNLGQVSAHPNEAMNSIKRMKLTGAAILVSRGMKFLQAAPAAYPYRSPAWFLV